MKLFFFASILFFCVSCVSERNVNFGVEKRIHRRGVHINFKQQNLPTAILPRRAASEEFYRGLTDDVEEPVAFPEIHTNDSCDNRPVHSFISGKSKDAVALVRPKQPPLNNDSFHSTVAPIVVEETYPTEDERTIPRGVTAIVAISIAILNLGIFMWVPVLGVLFTLLAIVFAVKAIKIESKTSKYLGVATFVLSSISLFVSVLMTLLMFSALKIFPI